jgi:hypothetical protein
MTVANKFCTKCGLRLGRKHTTEGCPMNDGLWKALMAWRQKHGRGWKKLLVETWSYAGADAVVGYNVELHVIRNLVGPEGLRRIRVKEGAWYT